MAKSTKIARAPKKHVTSNVPEQLAENLTAAGRNVWLASLGAVAAVGDETSNLFQTLVDKGRARERQARPKVTRLFEETGDRIGKLGGQVEKIVKDRTASVLHRVGVPSRDEIQLLIKRVEQLSAKVEYLASNRSQTAS